MAALPSALAVAAGPAVADASPSLDDEHHDTTRQDRDAPPAWNTRPRAQPCMPLLSSSSQGLPARPVALSSAQTALAAAKTASNKSSCPRLSPLGNRQSRAWLCYQPDAET